MRPARPSRKASCRAAAWPCCAPSRRSTSLKTDNDDQKVGINIVRKALQAPARQIVQNAGEDGSVVVGKILENNKYSFGYNAQTGEYGDLVAEGVIDPTKVVRCALQDAASVAGLLITTEAMVAERPKEAGPGDAGRRRHGRNGRHGRHGLLRSSLRSQQSQAGPGIHAGAFCYWSCAAARPSRMRPCLEHQACRRSAARCARPHAAGSIARQQPGDRQQGPTSAMTDIATRVYNHTWKIDPIVRSVLDTDFYKLLMAQTIFRRHRDAQVTFGIINRTAAVKLAAADRHRRAEGAARPHPHAVALRAANPPGCAATCSTASGRCSRPTSSPGSRASAFPPTTSSASGDQYELTFEGPWIETTMWEIPALAVLMELHSRAVTKGLGKFELQVLYARAMTRVWEKIGRLQAAARLCASPTSAPAAGTASCGRTGACRR